MPGQQNAPEDSKNQLTPAHSLIPPQKLKLQPDQLLAALPFENAGKFHHSFEINPNYPIRIRKRKKSPCSTNSKTINAMIGEKSMLKIGGIKWKRFKNGLTIRSKNIPNFVCKAPGNHDIKQYTTIANV